MGIGSLAGRIFLGLFAANKRLKPTVLFGLCIGLAGLPMLIVPQIKTYAELCVFVVWLGYFVGGQTTLQAVVLRHLVGADRLSQTLGWSMGLQAPAALGGGPIAGYNIVGNCLYVFKMTFLFGYQVFFMMHQETTRGLSILGALLLLLQLPSGRFFPVLDVMMLIEICFMKSYPLKNTMSRAKLM